MKNKGLIIGSIGFLSVGTVAVLGIVPAVQIQKNKKVINKSKETIKNLEAIINGEVAKNKKAVSADVSNLIKEFEAITDGEITDINTNKEKIKELIAAVATLNKNQEFTDIEYADFVEDIAAILEGGR